MRAMSEASKPVKIKDLIFSVTVADEETELILKYTKEAQKELRNLSRGLYKRANIRKFILDLFEGNLEDFTFEVKSSTI